jgi:YVTN family beta-propeller protein
MLPTRRTRPHLDPDPGPPDPRRRRRARPLVGVVVALAVLTPLAACGQTDDPTVSADDGREETNNGVGPDGGSDSTDSSAPADSGIETIAGMPPVIDASNIYSEAGSDNPNPATSGALNRVYVPNEVSGNVTVIDPATMEVIDTFPTGFIPQHVVPSYDMKTLYVLNNSGNTIVPIDPLTGEAQPAIPVDDPYNLYFTPDGTEAIIVAEAEQRLDFTDPKTFEVRSSLQTDCNGLNHLDYSIDGRFFIATCEFDGRMIKVDIESRQVVGDLQIDISQSGKQNPIKKIAQPQDVRLANDGSVFYVADLITDGIYIIDAASFAQVGFVRTGVAAHGLYPSRDGTKMYVVNRGTNSIPAPGSFKGRATGSIAVFDFATRTVVDEWLVPDNGSPDMGNLTLDGTQLWLGGRYDGEVYVFDTVKGELINRIPVGQNPHGLTVWPQPGRFSFGHTGNMR